MRIHNKTKGFTLIEIVIICAIILLLLSYGLFSLLNLQTTSSLNSLTDLLIEDIKTQQVKAMTGDTEGRGIPDEYGIYFTPASYTLFHGSSYSANNPDNFVSSLPEGYNIISTFPSSSLILQAGSGEILGFEPTQNSITIRNMKNGNQKKILLNKYGAVTNIQ